MSLNNSQIESLLLKRVQEAIKMRISEIANEEFDKAKQAIEKRRTEIITGTILEMEKVLTFEYHGMDLRITIKDEHKI